MLLPCLVAYPEELWFRTLVLLVLAFNFYVDNLVFFRNCTPGEVTESLCLNTFESLI